MEAYKLLPEYLIFGRTYGIGHAGNLVVEEKGGSDITVAALDCCVRRISVQYPVGSQEQICIPILCIYDPVCTGGIVSDGTSALQAAETQKIQKERTYTG